MGKIKHIDHLGNEFPSMKAMCDHWKISTDIYKYRIKNNYSVKDALTIPRHSYMHCTDHLGNKFKSLNAMCAHWGITLGAYKHRIKNGQSIKEILTSTNKNYVPCKDHLGNEFPTITAMCKYWGINRGTYDFRKNQGLTDEEILTAPNKKYQCHIDHMGNKFQSLRKMCEHWNVEPMTYKDRRKKGYSVKDALTADNKRPNMKSCIDHLGNEFESVKAMCAYWNVKYDTYRTRKYKGYSIEQILTADNPSPHGKTHIDHMGNTFRSIKSMCRHWNINEGTYRSRIKNGWSVQKALTTLNHGAQISDDCTIISQIDANYYECQINGQSIVMTHRQILEYRKKV